ncbi:helix-hairpin-helix domain-containing protein [Scopulibacillus cellulosilyticus]|uniref:Helix-hairpin-helix domain-containing protein n=1 Tax=Scopulibacillus cellulosilyticus TaxID=2665665 RepID=A0ABW2PVY2_9BACL
MIRKEKIPYIVAAVLLVILVYVSFLKPKSSEPEFPDEMQNKVAEQKDDRITDAANSKEHEQKQTDIIVDVKGAVKKPGVYHFVNGARIMDVISKAGGFNNDADQKQINMAQKLTDEMVVYIPHKGENVQNAGGAASAAPQGPANGNTDGAKGDKVNINSATEEELQKLPGIGPAKAAAIITYREKSGPFKTVDDLINVPGIGEKSLEQIKPEATVN